MLAMLSFALRHLLSDLDFHLPRLRNTKLILTGPLRILSICQPSLPTGRNACYRWIHGWTRCIRSGNGCDF